MNSKSKKELKSKNKQLKRKIRKLKRNTRNKIHKNRKIINRRRMPAAFTKSFSKQFRIIKQDGNSITVKGRDLVYAIPDDIVSNYQDTNVITIIPCNPCYWSGTRISAIANGYQNYRPIKFNVHYIPQCAVTQQGNVITGTIWNQVPNSNNLQQSLRTSSGGMLTQCYKTGISRVSMKSNLQFNLFRCGGKFDQESNPFLFIGLAIGCVNSNNDKIIPGYFYVDWQYSFKNPIGYSTVFQNTGLKKLNEIKLLPQSNSTLIAAQKVEDKNIEIGMLIQCDNIDDQIKFTYNNTEINLNINDEYVFWCFQNSTYNQPNQDEIGIEYEYYYFYSRTMTTEPFNGNQYTTYIWRLGNDIYSLYCPVSSVVNNDIIPNGTVFYLADREQSKLNEFGVMASANAEKVIFVNSIDDKDIVRFIEDAS